MKVYLINSFEKESYEKIRKKCRNELIRILNDDYKLICKHSDIKISEFGKPYIEGDICFSISYSERFAVIAIGKSNIGADIERITCDYCTIVERFFTKGEKKIIEASNNKDDIFCKIWTQKEAYAKWKGTGLREIFNKFDVTEERINKNFVSIKIKNFYLTIYSEHEHTLEICII